MSRESGLTIRALQPVVAGLRALGCDSESILAEASVPQEIVDGDPQILPRLPQDLALTMALKTIRGAEENMRSSPLKAAELSTRLTQVAAYRQTICGVEDPDYVVRRITPDPDPAMRIVETVAGTPGIDGDANRDGPALLAQFEFLQRTFREGVLEYLEIDLGLSQLLA